MVIMSWPSLTHAMTIANVRGGGQRLVIMDPVVANVWLSWIRLWAAWWD